jgi:hypothetical protein
MPVSKINEFVKEHICKFCNKSIYKCSEEHYFKSCQGIEYFKQSLLNLISEARLPVSASMFLNLKEAEAYINGQYDYHTNLVVAIKGKDE